MKLTMTATGDSILIQGIPEGGYEGYDELVDWIAKGDAKFANLEMCVTDYDTYASTYCGGTWINARPEILDQLKGFGYDFLGYANNHAMDYGPDGCLETIEHAKARGFKIAGAGKTLTEASEAVYKTCKGGRVAFLAMTSSFDDSARAGYPSKGVKGRPGLNGLRISKKLILNEAHYNAMREIAAVTKLNGSKDNSRANGFTPALPEGVFEFDGLSLKLSEDGTEAKVTSCNKKDLNRMLSAIKDAKNIADYVVIMFHSHQIKADRSCDPDDFAIEFAHACIDAGADVIIGNGTHSFKPIEIYNGKPIFYSMGNFCYQSNVLEHSPADFGEKYNLDGLSDVQAYAARNKGWTTGLHTKIENFRTYIPLIEFEDGKLTNLTLKPVHLGFEKPRTFKGIPYPAKGEKAKEIYEILRDISALRGTKITFDGELMHVEI